MGKILGIVDRIMSSITNSSSSSSAAARSLSPGDESRFVPRPFSSGRESADGGSGCEAAPGEGEGAPTAEASSGAKGDDDASGIMGATICFTPEASPRPPSNDLARDSSSNPGTICGAGGGGRGPVAAGGMVGSAMHVASSLDGRSTTEYELLDGISTRGTLVPEDLISDGDEGEGPGAGLTTNEKEGGSDGGGGLTGVARGATSLPSLSPCGTVPSLDDTPLKTFKTPHPGETKPPRVPDLRLLPSPLHHEAFRLEPELDEEDDTPPMMTNVPPPRDTNPPQVTNEDLQPPPVPPEPVQSGLGVDSTGANKILNDSENAGARRLLSPFKNPYENWETQSGFTGMTRSAIGRMFPAGTLRVVTGAKKSHGFVDSKVRGVNNMCKTPDAADGSASESQVKLGSDEDSPNASNQLGEQMGDEAQVISRAETFALSLREVAGSAFSHFLSALFFALTFLNQMASSAKVWILRCSVMSRGTAKTGAADTPNPGIDKVIPKPDIGKVARSSDDLTGLNFSKLFSDESEEDGRKSGLMRGSALQTEVDMCGGSGNGVNSTAPDYKEDSPKRPDDAAKIGNGYFSGPRAIRVGCGIALCALVATILTYWNDTLLEGVVHMDQESGICVQQEDSVLDLSSRKEDFNSTCNKDASDEHFLCFSTKTASLFSVPLWEFNLSPASFEIVEEKIIDGQTSNQVCGLPAFLVLSFTISLFCAFAFKSTKSAASIKPRAVRRNKEKDKEHLTGIWTEEEHEQFLMGYNVHGSRWKLVSAFVPTRNHAQVSSHGSYWLKMRSPEKMKRARKTPGAQNTAPKHCERKVPITPLAETSTKSTPKKSNKRDPLPVKGILLEKNNNKIYKNVTPRSADRTRRLRINKEGSKSDPIKKRVRISAP